LPETAELRPVAPYMNWRVRQSIVTLRCGCFRLSATESLHRFNPDSPEECEQESGHEDSADSLGATVQFIVNDGNGENQERISTELSGEGDSKAVPFSRPQPLLGNAKTLK